MGQFKVVGVFSRRGGLYTHYYVPAGCQVNVARPVI